MVIQAEEHDFLVHDLLWSFFVSALNSYRYDSILRPYPQKYVDQRTKEKDVTQLQGVASRIPSIPELFHQQDVLHPESVELFDWVTSCTNFKLAYKSLSEFKAIRGLTKQELPAAEPNHVFEVIHSENRECRFQERKKAYGSIHAYHGSRLENFYSILRNGLVSHLSKNGAFGSGTYFSSELSVSLLYSFSSKGWRKSLLGTDLSCVAVCEIIKDPSVKFSAADGHQMFSHDIIDEKVPEKYFIVFNDDLVLLRYLLVYSFGAVQKRRCAHVSWWRRHIFAIFLISYILVLLAVILSK